MITNKKTAELCQSGQEVRNNQKNCAAYSIYSHALLTIGSGVFHIIDIYQTYLDLYAYVAYIRF